MYLYITYLHLERSALFSFIGIYNIYMSYICYIIGKGMVPYEERFEQIEPHIFLFVFLYISAWKKLKEDLTLYGYR